jgi:hypothetical protein
MLASFCSQVRMHVFSADWSTGVGDRDYDQNMIRRVVLSSVAIVLICAISPIRGLAETPPPSVHSSTVGLSEPSCYRHGFLWRNEDCTARNLWRQIKPILDGGNSDKVLRATSAIVGPPASATAGLANVLELTGVKPRCAAEGLNAYLKATVSIKQTTSTAKTLLDAALRAPSKLPAIKAYVTYLKQVLPTVFNAVAAIGNYSQARAAIINIAYCSV